MGVAVGSSGISNASDALFREWVGEFIDLLVEAGLTQTADTGQFNPASSLAPTSNSTYTAYAVFYLDDALHSTAPIYLRFDFGSGSSGTQPPVVRLTVGRGSNGSGTIISELFQSLLGRTTGFTATATASQHFASVGEGYVAFTGFVDEMATVASNSHPLFFVLERSRDADGTPNGDAFSILYIAISNNSGVSPANDTSGWFPSIRAINYTTGTYYDQGVPVSGITSFNGAAPGPSTSIAAGGIGPVFPWVILAPGLSPWQSCAAVSVPYGDHPTSDFETVLCGHMHTFRPLPPSSTASQPSQGWNRKFGGSTSMATSPLHYGWYGLAIRWEA